MPTHSHYESSPIPNLGFLPNVVAIERFEGVLEKMDDCRQRDNTRSELFSDGRLDIWD